MKEPDLDNRHRDKNGEISKKHGNTVISTLRQTYGQGFAPGQPGHKKLSEILHEFRHRVAEPARQRPAAAPVCVTKPRCSSVFAPSATTAADGDYRADDHCRLPLATMQLQVFAMVPKPKCSAWL